jgi:hypothetical protein
MASIVGVVSMYQSSVNGLGREFDRAAVAAAKIARSSLSDNDKVTISAEARSQPMGSADSSPEQVERAMVDLRVAKYSAIANMRVLSVADDMAHELANMVDPTRSR